MQNFVKGNSPVKNIKIVEKLLILKTVGICFHSVCAVGMYLKKPDINSPSPLKLTGLSPVIGNLGLLGLTTNPYY